MHSARGALVRILIVEPFQVIKTEHIQNVPIQKTSLLSRFRKYDGDSQNFPKFPTSDHIRSDPIGRKESPLQRKPRLNGLQNKTSAQSTLRIAYKYGSRVTPPPQAYLTRLIVGIFES